MTRLTDDIASVEVKGEDFSSAPVGFDDLSVETGPTPPPPDFGVGADTGSAAVRQGDFLDVPISINRLNGSNGDITFSVSGLPAGMRAAFTPNPVSGTGGGSTLRLTADNSAAASPTYTEITVTATPGPGAGGAPKSFKKLVRISENCERTFIGPYMDVRTFGCMRTLGPDKLEVFNQTVRVNGLELKPLEGKRTLIIDKKNGTSPRTG